MEEATLNDLEDSMTPIRRVLLAALASALLVACGSPPPPPVTPQDIQQAAGRGELPSLYAEIKLDLADSKLKDDNRRELELRLSEVGRRLAEKAESKVTSALDRAKLASGFVPLNGYESQDGRLTEVEEWSPAVYQRISTRITDGRAKTLDRISVLEAEVYRAARLPQSRSEAEDVRSKARREAHERVVLAEADATRFKALREVHHAAPGVWRNTRLLDSLIAGTKGKRKILIGRPGGVLIDLNLQDKVSAQELGIGQSGFAPKIDTEDGVAGPGKKD